MQHLIKHACTQASATYHIQSILQYITNTCCHEKQPWKTAYSLYIIIVPFFNQTSINIVYDMSLQLIYTFK